MVLLHENEKEIFGDIPERVLDIVESVNRPSLRLAWDAANYVQVGVTPFTAAYELLKPHTVYIQVKDALLATGEVVPAGEGDGQMPRDGPGPAGRRLRRILLHGAASRLYQPVGRLLRSGPVRSRHQGFHRNPGHRRDQLRMTAPRAQGQVRRDRCRRDR